MIVIAQHEAQSVFACVCATPLHEAQSVFSCVCATPLMSYCI
jgi:hypothetical protein